MSEDVKPQMDADGRGTGREIVAAACSLIVTNGDIVLCRDCYEEGHSEMDPTTHYFAAVQYGVCDCCGMEVKKANAAGHRQVPAKGEHE